MTCIFCAAVGVWPRDAVGSLDVCPSCQESPLRQAWYVEVNALGAALGAAMRLEAFGRGLPTSHVAITPEITTRWRALGSCPA
jgi:hypothetical protein